MFVFLALMGGGGKYLEQPSLLLLLQYIQCSKPFEIMLYSQTSSYNFHYFSKSERVAFLIAQVKISKSFCDPKINFMIEFQEAVANNLLNSSQISQSWQAFIFFFRKNN